MSATKRRVHVFLTERQVKYINVNFPDITMSEAVRRFVDEAIEQRAARFQAGAGGRT